MCMYILLVLTNTKMYIPVHYITEDIHFMAYKSLLIINKIMCYVA